LDQLNVLSNPGAAGAAEPAPQAPPPSQPHAAPSTLDPKLGEFTALGERGKVAEAMAVVGRFVRGGRRRSSKR
jgi:hypothetical protein